VPGDQFPLTVSDDELLAEVTLTTALIEAATQAPAPLSQAQVDELLGLTTSPDAQPSTPEP
jgi:acyl-CoA thioesterase FadM